MQKWIIVGMLTFVLDYMLFFGFYSINSNIYSANLFSGVLTTLTNYVLHKKWTFNDRESHLKTIPKYITALIFYYVLNIVVINMCLIVPIQIAAAKVVAAAVQASLGYFVLNKYVFNRVNKDQV